MVANMVTVDITGHPGNMTDVRKSKLMKKTLKRQKYDCKSNKKLLVYVKINVQNIYIMYFSEEISIRQVYCFILCPSTLDFSQTILTNHIHGSIINNFWIRPSQ
jgi:hypothetical protein